MAKIVSKCCICGRVYHIRRCKMEGTLVTDRLVSYGICNNDCNLAKEVQVIISDNSGASRIEYAFIVGKRVFHNGKFIKSFIMVNKQSFVAEHYKWIGGMGYKISSIGKSFTYDENTILRLV